MPFSISFQWGTNMEYIIATLLIVIILLQVYTIRFNRSACLIMKNQFVATNTFRDAEFEVACDDRKLISETLEDLLKSHGVQLDDIERNIKVTVDCNKRVINAISKLSKEGIARSKVVKEARVQLSTAINTLKV